MTTPFDDNAIRPYLKADAGTFGRDLKMPLLAGQPGRRPGDFCLDDAVGLVRVRRGDQTVLNLGLSGATPSWASTVGVANNSGISIVVDGNIAMSMASATISTFDGDLTLSPDSGNVNITGGSVLNFSSFGIVATTGGTLTLRPSNGLVDVFGNALAFNQSATISTPSGDDLSLFAPGTGRVAVNGSSAAVPGTLRLANAYLITNSATPPSTSILGGVATLVSIGTSNSVTGAVMVTVNGAGAFQISFTFAALYPSVPNVFLQPTNTNYTSGSSLIATGTTTALFVANAVAAAAGTCTFNYFVIGQ